LNGVGGGRRVEGSHVVAGDILPLTAQQADRLNQLRARDQAGRPVPAVHCPAAMVTVRGEIDLSALTGAVGEVLRRQAALRTRFVSTDGSVTGQFIVDDSVAPAVMEPLGDNPERRRAGVSALLNQWCRHEFDLDGAMADITVFPVSTDEVGLLVRADQLVADLWSLNLIIGDLGRAYDHATGRTGPPDPLPVSYSQAVRAEVEWLAGADGLAARRRCARLAQTVEPLPLPGGPGPVGQLGTLSWQMSGDDFEELRAACQRHRTTVVTATLGALGAAIAERLDRDAVSVLVVFTGRDRREYQSVVMWRSTMLPVRVEALQGRKFSESLRAVQRASFLAMENQRVPWPVIMGDHGLSTQPDGRPPVEVSLQYIPKELGSGRIADGFQGLHVESRMGTACPTGAAIDVLVSEHDDGIAGRVSFRQDLLDTELVDTVVADMSRLLVELGTHPRKA
jgi:hypothetical protein